MNKILYLYSCQWNQNMKLMPMLLLTPFLLQKMLMGKLCKLNFFFLFLLHFIFVIIQLLIVSLWTEIFGHLKFNDLMPYTLKHISNQESNNIELIKEQNCSLNSVCFHFMLYSYQFNKFFP